MSTAEDLIEFKKQFAGTWQYDREENLKAYLDAQGASDENKKAELEAFPKMTFSMTEGGIKMDTNLGEGIGSFQMTFKLGEPTEFKEAGFHTEFKAVMRGSEFYEEVKSLTADGGKPIANTLNVVNGELVMVSWVQGLEDETKVAKRYFKRVQV